MWGMMVYDNLRALDYLETRPEVDVKRIATMGYGETKPIASNVKEESRKMNRRVEFIVIKK